MKILNRSFILNLLLILVISALMFLLVNIFLTLYTKHNKESFLPTGIGKDFNSVALVLDSLKFDMHVDSVYRKNYKPGEIINQTPKGGANVKARRNIHITYNLYTRPKVSLPDFRNLTLRSASILLRKNNLEIGDTMFKHDISKGIILEQWVNGRRVTPGTMVPMGMRVSFLVSAGLGEPNIPMELLIGRTYPEMMSFLLKNELNPQIIWTGPIMDTLNARVYAQFPMHINIYGMRNYVPAGEYINVSIMQNPSDSLLKKNAHVEIIPLPQSEYLEDRYQGPAYGRASDTTDEIILLDSPSDTTTIQQLDGGDVINLEDPVPQPIGPPRPPDDTKKDKKKNDQKKPDAVLPKQE